MNSLTQFSLLFETSVQESTKFTPFFLMHGREARFPLEAENSEITSVSQLGDVQQAVHHLKEMRKKVFPQVKENIENNQERQKQQYRKRKGAVVTLSRLDRLFCD